MKNFKLTQKDGTQKVHTTPRIEGTFLYFTGRGDDLVGGNIGEGPELILKNTDGSPMSAKTVVFGFSEDIWLKDGYIFWKGGDFGDYGSMEIFLPANTYYKTPHSTGNYDLIDGVYVANATWTGEYLMLPIDYTLNRFVNKVHLVGDNTVGLLLESSDIDVVTTQLRMRVIMGSPSVNPNLEMAVTMEMYRTKTI